MTQPKRLVGALAVAASAASLIVPSAASARAGDRSYQQTYPLASQVCAEVAAGRRPHLQRFLTRVLADCARLQNGFTAAQGAALAIRASVDSALVVDRAAIAIACPPPMVGRPPCESVRDSENASITALRHEWANAARHYWRVIEANRRVFWNAIHSLPGDSRLRADRPIPEGDS